jgi:hypothetical protein
VQINFPYELGVNFFSDSVDKQIKLLADFLNQKIKPVLVIKNPI